jgi:hypothetical protein
MMTAIAVGTIKNEMRERALLATSLLLPLEYQTRKVAMAISNIETKK